MRIWCGVKTALDWSQQENSLLYDRPVHEDLHVVWESIILRSFLFYLMSKNTGKGGQREIPPCVDSCCCMWRSQRSFGVSPRHVQHTQPLQWCSSSSIPSLLFSSEGTIVLKSRWRASAHCCLLVAIQFKAGSHSTGLPGGESTKDRQDTVLLLDGVWHCSNTLMGMFKMPDLDV